MKILMAALAALLLFGTAHGSGIDVPPSKSKTNDPAIQESERSKTLASKSTRQRRSQQDARKLIPLKDFWVRSAEPYDDQYQGVATELKVGSLDYTDITRSFFYFPPDIPQNANVESVKFVLTYKNSVHPNPNTSKVRSWNENFELFSFLWEPPKPIDPDDRDLTWNTQPDELKTLDSKPAPRAEQPVSEGATLEFSSDELKKYIQERTSAGKPFYLGLKLSRETGHQHSYEFYGVPNRYYPEPYITIDYSLPTSRQINTNSTTGGSVSGGGTINLGTTTTLEATPSEGYEFTGWSGDASGKANPLTITVDADKTITATFALKRFTITVNSSAGGSVSGSGAYEKGTVTTLTASPDSGYEFTGWSGDASGKANPLTITVDADKTITANFNTETVTNSISDATYLVDLIKPGVGTLTGSASHHSLGPANAIDGDATPGAGSGRWLALQSELPNVFLQYQFPGGAKKRATSYWIMSQINHASTRAPKSFKLQGSSDGANWTDLDVVTGETDWGADEWRSYDVDSPAEYSHYRLVISEAAGVDDYVGIREVKLFGPRPAYAGITLSNATVEENQSAGTVVGNLFAGDGDTGEAYSFILADLVQYPDNAAFTIEGNQLRTSGKFDFETKNEYTIQVRSSETFEIMAQRLRVAMNYLDPTDKIKTAAFDPDEWHYIAVTKGSDNSGDVYVNGSRIYGGQFRDRDYRYNYLELGTSRGHRQQGGDYYNGMIDEFRLSKKVRTGEEIKDYYQSSAPFVADNDTIGLWHFDEGSGTVIQNKVGEAGSLVGDVKYVDGKFGTALSLDGIDDRGDFMMNIPEYNLTFEFWVKGDASPKPIGGTLIYPWGAYNSHIFIRSVFEAETINSDSDQVFAISVTDLFEVPGTIEVTATSTSGGSVSGGGTFDHGTTVALAATPNTGYLFTGWSGDATGTSNPLTITVASAKTITANFAQDTNDDDGDGLSNYAELVTHGTKADDSDTDDDGLLDNEELQIGTDPKSSDATLVNFFNAKTATDQTTARTNALAEGRTAGIATGIAAVKADPTAYGRPH